MRAESPVDQWLDGLNKQIGYLLMEVQLVKEHVRGMLI